MCWARQATFAGQKTGGSLNTQTSMAKSPMGFQTTSQWRNQFKMNFLKVANGEVSSRTLRSALRCLNKYAESGYCWGAFSNTTLTTRQIQLLQRGADWMTPLGGAKSKCNLIYMCTKCAPNQGWCHQTGGILPLQPSWWIRGTAS